MGDITWTDVSHSKIGWAPIVLRTLAAETYSAGFLNSFGLIDNEP